MTVRLVIMSFLCLHVPESITNQFICKYIYISIYTYWDPASFFPSCSGLFEGWAPMCTGVCFKNQNCQDAWWRPSESAVVLGWTGLSQVSSARFDSELNLGWVEFPRFTLKYPYVVFQTWKGGETWKDERNTCWKQAKKVELRQPPLIFGSFQDRAEAKCHPFSWRCNRLQRLNKNTLRDEEILSTWSCKDRFAPIFSRDGHGPCQKKKAREIKRTSDFQEQPSNTNQRTTFLMKRKTQTSFLLPAFGMVAFFFLCCRNSSSHLAIFVLSSLDLVTSLSPPLKIVIQARFPHKKTPEAVP